MSAESVLAMGASFCLNLQAFEPRQFDRKNMPMKTSIKNLFLLLTLIVGPGTILVACVSAQTYTTLDDPPGVGGTSVFGISGNYVVGGYTDANDYGNGFLYNISTGAYTTLDDPLGVNGTVTP
jgi:hypothetical protein